MSQPFSREIHSHVWLTSAAGVLLTYRMRLLRPFNHQALAHTVSRTHSQDALRPLRGTACRNNTSTSTTDQKNLCLTSSTSILLFFTEGGVTIRREHKSRILHARRTMYKSAAATESGMVAATPHCNVDGACDLEVKEVRSRQTWKPIGRPGTIPTRNLHFPHESNVCHNAEGRALDLAFGILCVVCHEMRYL